MDRLALHELIGRWWVNYDEGKFDVLDSLVTDDVSFSCRTDTGSHPYESFIAATANSRQELDDFHRPHRAGSPYPLRHNSSNLHVTAERDDEVDLRCYLFVTDIVDAKPSPLSSGIADFTVRETADGPKVAGLHLVLDYAATKSFA